MQYNQFKNEGVLVITIYIYHLVMSTQRTYQTCLLLHTPNVRQNTQHTDSIHKGQLRRQIGVLGRKVAL